MVSYTSSKRRRRREEEDKKKRSFFYYYFFFFLDDDDDHHHHNAENQIRLQGFAHSMTRVLRNSAMPGPLTPRHKGTVCGDDEMAPKTRDSTRSALLTAVYVTDYRALPCIPGARRVLP